MRETITLNRKEQTRLMVLAQVDRGECTAPQAAEVLALSLRQVRRLLAAYRQEGVAALAHGNRGRAPHNRLKAELRQQVLTLAQGRYAGVNHQHLTELLAGREQVHLSRSSLRRILHAAGMTSPRKRRAPRHRTRRERQPQEGMLLQLDASHHDWREGRGPRLTLLGAIDDATGTVPAAHFQEQEDARGYFLLFQEIVTTRGIPLAVYRDRHAVFAPTQQQPWSLEDELAGHPAPTQFGRLLEELGVRSIAARSPQAKGRIERRWGTFQDRLVTELRLGGGQHPGGRQRRAAGVFAPLYRPLWGTGGRGWGRLPAPGGGGGPGHAVLLQATSAPWAPTTWCSSDGCASRCRPTASGPAMLGPRWRCRRAWMAVWR